MEGLKEFRKINGITQEMLGEYLGVKKSFLSKIETGKEKMPKEKLSKLLQNDRDWDTSMLISDSRKILELETDSRKTLELEAHYVPVLPIAALGGGLSISESINMYDCERSISPIPGSTMIVPVYGDSMEPEYPSGSRVVVRKVDESIFVEWGKAYVVDTKNGAILKKIRQCQEKDYLLCCSVNSDYEPFVVAKKDILGLYKVLMVMAMK